jgi:hypothetical protein
VAEGKCSLIETTNLPFKLTATATVICVYGLPKKIQSGHSGADINLVGDTYDTDLGYERPCTVTGIKASRCRVRRESNSGRGILTALFYKLYCIGTE